MVYQELKSTGSLGHGLAIAAGMAFANKQKNIFVVLSDGELQEVLFGKRPY